MTELIELLRCRFRQALEEILTAVRDDLKNRNDRGKLRSVPPKNTSRAELSTRMSRAPGRESNIPANGGDGGQKELLASLSGLVRPFQRGFDRVQSFADAGNAGAGTRPVPVPPEGTRDRSRTRLPLIPTQTRSIRKLGSC